MLLIKLAHKRLTNFRSSKVRDLMSKFNSWLQIFRKKDFIISREEEVWLKLYFVQGYIEKEGNPSLAQEASRKKQSIIQEQRQELIKKSSTIGISIPEFSNIYGYLTARNNCDHQLALHQEWLDLQKELEQLGLDYTPLCAPYDKKVLQDRKRLIDERRARIDYCGALIERGTNVGLTMPSIDELIHDIPKEIELRVEIDDREAIWQNWDNLEQWYYATFGISHQITLKERLQWLNMEREASYNFIKKQKSLFEHLKQKFESSPPQWVLSTITLPLTQEIIDDAPVQFEFDKNWRTLWEEKLENVDPLYKTEVKIPDPPLQPADIAAVNKLLKTIDRKNRLRKILLFFPRLLHTLTIGLVQMLWKWNPLICIVCMFLAMIGITNLYDEYMLRLRVEEVIKEAKSIGWDIPLSKSSRSYTISKYEKKLEYSLLVYPKLLKLQEKAKSIGWEVTLPSPPYKEKDFLVFKKNIHKQVDEYHPKVTELLQKSRTIGWEPLPTSPPYQKSDIDQAERQITQQIDDYYPRVTKIKEKAKSIQWDVSFTGPPYKAKEIVSYEKELASLAPYIGRGMNYKRATKQKIYNLLSSVRIPSGSFMMGCATDDRRCEDDERPQQQVTISTSLYISKYEVTQELYEEVMGKNPSYYTRCGKKCPVERVSWFDAVQFSNKLNEKIGLTSCYTIKGETSFTVEWNDKNCLGWRLPTEAEWEYAARGGESYRYAGSNYLNTIAWHDGNNRDKTHPVGKKDPNQWGIYDMTGNVWEWVWDPYDDNEYPYSNRIDPVSTKPSNSRVERSAGWFNKDSKKRSELSARCHHSPTSTNSNRGFRIVRRSSSRK